MPPAAVPGRAAAALLGWYDRHRRELPWRAPPGAAAPYRVWLSEIMLQQTTVAAVAPYYARFLAAFPTVQALAAAPAAEVLRLWAGLGYYARARNLHRAAQAVAAAGGRFPADEAGLRALPGVGRYTAAAVAAIAFGRPAVPVDGNVERVLARLCAVTEPLPAAKPALHALATELGAQRAARARPGDLAQALFDLGATVCAPRRPACALCPWRADCAARRAGLAESLPARARRTEKPRRHGIACWIEDAAGRVLLARRPPRGLLGGMLALPGTPWRAEPWQRAEALAALGAALPVPLPARARWRWPAAPVRHVFTHFALDLGLALCRVPKLPDPLPEGFHAVPQAEVRSAGLPSLYRKAAALALAEDRSGG